MTVFDPMFICTSEARKHGFGGRGEGVLVVQTHQKSFSTFDSDLISSTLIGDELHSLWVSLQSNLLVAQPQYLPAIVSEFTRENRNIDSKIKSAACDLEGTIRNSSSRLIDT